MRVQRKDIEFRISRRMLWVGEQAYPLHNVTRVRPVEAKPNRGRLFARYFREAGAWMGLGIVGLLILGCLGDAVPPAVSVTYIIVVLGILVAYTVRLIRGLTLPTLHILSVATAGSPHAALVSTNKDLIHDLTQRIADAIDNPAMEFAITVDHVEVVQGDKVHGNKYLGSHLEGGNIQLDTGS